MTFIYFPRLITLGIVSEIKRMLPVELYKQQSVLTKTK